MVTRKKAMRFVLGGCALVFLALLVSCKGGPAQTVRYVPLMDKKFESVKQPAQVSALTESQLKAQGYIKIGDLYVEQISRACREGALSAMSDTGPHFADDCKDHVYPETPTEVLTKQAAERGGQMVVLVASNKTSKRDAPWMTGFCKSYNYETRTEQEPVYTSSGSYYRTVQRQYKTCREFYPARGEDTFQWSNGTVWRKME